MSDSRIAAALNELDELEAFVRSWHRSSKQSLTEQYLHFASVIASMKKGDMDPNSIVASLPTTPTEEEITKGAQLASAALSTPTSATATSSKPTPTAATVAARILNKDAPVFRPLFGQAAAPATTTVTQSSATNPSSHQTSSVGFDWESLMSGGSPTLGSTPSAADAPPKSTAIQTKSVKVAELEYPAPGSFTVAEGGPATYNGPRTAIMRSSSNLSSAAAVASAAVPAAQKFIDSGADYDSFLDEYITSSKQAVSNPFASATSQQVTVPPASNVVGKPSTSPSVLETSLLNMSGSSSTATGYGNHNGIAGGPSSSNGALGGTRSSAVLTAPSSPNNNESATAASQKHSGGATTSCQVLVEFKRKRVLQFESKEFVTAGEFVVVGGDRGEDIGVVTHVWPTGTAEPTGAWSGGIGIGKVLRPATLLEISQLQGVQFELESRAVEVAQEKVVEHQLPMRIVDAEYQFDRKKLTFYYQSNHRLDFRNLVRDLYKTFRARIWMEQD